MSSEPQLPPCPHCGGEAERFGCHGWGCEKCGSYSMTRKGWSYYVAMMKLGAKQRKETDGGQ